MKETVNASIAGIGFTFTKDAYREMEAYTARLEAAYAALPEGTEIIADIEARIVELILSRQEADAIVDTGVANSVIRQLGEPEPGNLTAGIDQKQPAVPGVFTKRLYRNMEGAKLGGVCNGLATYFRTDPAWIRLMGFVPLLLLILLPPIARGSFAGVFLGFLGTLFGTFVLLYFILWIIIPAARTPRQKLEMAGNKVTAMNISDLAGQSSFSAGKKHVQDSVRESPSQVFSSLAALLGRLIIVGIKATAVFFMFVFGLVALVLLSAMIGVVIRPELYSWGEAGIMQLAPLWGISHTGFVVLVLASIAIPFLIIIYLMASAVFNFRISRIAMWILVPLWLLCSTYGTAVFITNYDILTNRDNIETIWDEESKRGRKLHQWRNKFLRTGKWGKHSGGVIAPAQFPDEEVRDTLPGAQQIIVPELSEEGASQVTEPEWIEITAD